MLPIVLVAMVAGMMEARASKMPASDNSIIITTAAYYPRGALSSNAVSLVAVEAPNATARRLALFENVTGLWTQKSIIAIDSNLTAQPDLANPFLLSMPGRLCCAYRHHTGLGAFRVYRIGLSVSFDDGFTWQALNPAVEGATGVWEPFLYLTSASPDTINLVYAAEITNGGEQDIVLQTSTDAGATWSPVVSRIHTDGSRNGMPGVVELADSSLLAVFEGFWAGVWGWFTVNSARSFDGGLTWPQRSVVHQAPSPFNSGSPQVGVCPISNRICAIYMTNEDGPSGVQWPDGAHISSSCTAMNTTNASLPLAWNTSAATLVPTLTPTAYWPGLFMSKAGMYVTYQTSDGDAALEEAPFC